VIDLNKEEAIKEHMAQNPIKTAQLYTKIFNSMDNRCKQLCFTNPGRPMTDYCANCQKMMKRLIGGK
jgi:hypothetical protein